MTEAAWRCVKALAPCFSVAYSLLSRVWACPLSCFPPIMAFSCYSGSAVFCPLPCALFAPYPSVMQRFELRQFCSVVRFRYDGISHLGALPPLFAVRLVLTARRRTRTRSSCTPRPHLTSAKIAASSLTCCTLELARLQVRSCLSMPPALRCPLIACMAVSRFWTSFFVAFAYYITCYSVVMEFGQYRDLLILPMVVNVLLMLVTFFLGVVPNSVVFRRTGCRRVCLLVGLCAAADLATDVLHYSKCPSCAYCPFILKTLFFSGMVMPLLVYWSLLLDSLYWLGMTNDIAGTSDMSGYDNVAIDQPLVGISLNHQAASELAQSLGSQSMKRVVLIPHNRIKLKVHMSKLQLLGTGGTAKVYKGMYNDKFGPKPCAVKVSFFVEFNPEVIREVIREAGLCGTIKHSRIVEFYGISVMPPSIALVFELCEHGSLEKFLRRGRGRLNEKNKLLLCLDCALAVECLHSIQNRCLAPSTLPPAPRYSCPTPNCSDGLHFSHGDLKSPNFLVTREGVVGSVFKQH